MNRKYRRSPSPALALGVVLAAALVTVPAALGQPLPTTSYQGYLEQNGTPVNNPSATLTFRLFRNATGGTALWTETKNNVAITDGVFNVALGSQVALTNTLFDGLLFLSVAVGNASAPQLTPRTVLRAVPYARTLSVPARVVGSPSEDGNVIHVENQAASGHGSGVYGSSASPDGQGVIGWATAPFGYAEGVIGRSEASQGRGVMGLAMAPEGLPVGVYGYSASTRGIGVLGEVPAAGGAYTQGVVGRGYFGVTGYSDSPAGIGVEGHDYNGTGRAGLFSGSVTVSGWLSKAGGSFEIDHPLDPENRVLRHSFVESPDMMNVYNGIATLDRRGEAVVTLPEWFEALNRDFRYQLTCVGGWAPVYVAERIAFNRFTIAGGTPGLEVSWQVTGVRQDAWAEENRIVVEEDKKPEDRGLYLHPSAFGRPRERGVYYDPEREADHVRRREQRTRIEEEHTRLREAPARLEAERARREIPPPYDQ